MDNKLIGIVLVLVGAGLLYWGYNDSQSVASQVSETFAGSMPDKVLYKYIGGAVVFLAGLYLILKKR